MLGAVGVVFGDIGTSPLYAIKESFGHGALTLEPENLFRILSLIFWLLFMVVTFKYVTFIMRAGNKGEGGDFALLSLAQRLTKANPPFYYFLGLVGILSGSLFYADAVITPAISVLSAVEGLEVVEPALHRGILPVTIIILIALFMIQRYGTGKMGGLFGPVMVLWFGVIGFLGFQSILQTPEILQAINPYFALEFIGNHPGLAFIALGTAVLAVTGAEALYADMGHFSARAIKTIWFAFVWPCLLLNYFGQGALLLRDPSAIKNPFFLLVPEDWSLPLLLLATAATVIASQAVISGTFSLTRQAILLGYLPRMRVLYTSVKEKGQVYIPLVNWLLFVSVISVVLVFQSSSGLAAAYGIAVTGAMLGTDIMSSVVMRLKWRWGLFRVISLVTIFILIDGTLLSATMTKVTSGGSLPIGLAIGLFTILTTWKAGQKILNAKLEETSISVPVFIQNLSMRHLTRVAGTAVFMTPRRNIVPGALLHNMKHNKVLHERVIFLTIIAQDVPYMPPEKKIVVYPLGKNFFQLDLFLGFKDMPDVPGVLRACTLDGIKFDEEETSFFLGKEVVVPSPGSGMAIWREHLYAWMKQNASSAVEYYNIPADRVVELGGRHKI